MDEVDLRSAAHFAAFEMYHFLYYTGMYREDPGLRVLSATLGPGFRQAIEYSILLHLRVLIDFFYYEPRQDDCWVGHFRTLPGFSAAFPPRNPRAVRQDQRYKAQSE
jgi:hypothetical protein